MKVAIDKFAMLMFLSVFFTQPGLAETAVTAKARDALVHERWDQALEAANIAISLDAKNGDAYSIRGKVHFKHEQFDKALADFDSALRVKPGLIDPALYQYRAQCHIQKDELPLAVSDLQHAIRLYPSSTEYQLLGQVYNRLNKLEESIDCLNHAIALDKKSYWTYRDRAEVYARLKNYASALSDYSTFIKLNPAAPVGYNLRAQIYLKMGKKELAESDFQQARKIEKFD